MKVDPRVTICREYRASAADAKRIVRQVSAGCHCDIASASRDSCWSKRLMQHPSWRFCPTGSHLIDTQTVRLIVGVARGDGERFNQDIARFGGVEDGIDP